MTIANHPVVMIQSDHDMLSKLVSEPAGKATEQLLSEELNRSIIVNDEAFPKHTIRLNSKVSLLDLSSQDTIELTIVQPEFADSRSNMISILTPMGVALIGFRKGEEAFYNAPGGIKKYTIQDVDNSSHI